MKLPILSGIEVIKILCKVGFRITRQSGSHIILINDENPKRTVVVPKHKELAIGTLLSIITQSGLSREEFMEFLR